MAHVLKVIPVDDPLKVADQKIIIDQAIADNGDRPGAVMLVLNEVQGRIGHVSPSMQAYIARNLNVPLGQVHGVVTFYSFFNTQPRGKHTMRLPSNLDRNPTHGGLMIAPTIEHDIPTIVQAAIEAHGAQRDALIPILSEINRALGYIPAEAIQEVRRQLQSTLEPVYVSEGQLFGLVSFYDMLSTKPRGRHVIKFCENAPCHVVGGKPVWDALREMLDLENGETTPDKKWTLVTTSCLGLCSVGPVVLIDDDLYGNVSPEQIDDILARYE